MDIVCSQKGAKDLKIRNKTESWGAVSIALHWLTAAVVVGLFALGLWMVDLGYHSAWYYRGPHTHKGVGLLLFGLTLARLAWRLSHRGPDPPEGQTRMEIAAARTVHALLYLLLFAVMASGYLISTADGRPVSVFGWVDVPAVWHGPNNQADVAGRLLRVLAAVLMATALLHALAALKHHIFDKDATLKRMLGRQ